jgi:hypothetical protein
MKVHLTLKLMLGSFPVHLHLQLPLPLNLDLASIIQASINVSGSLIISLSLGKPYILGLWGFLGIYLIPEVFTCPINPLSLSSTVYSEVHKNAAWT